MNLKLNLTMALLYLGFLVSLIIIILDIKSPAHEKKLTSWNRARLKIMLSCWASLIVTFIPIAIHLFYWATR